MPPVSKSSQKLLPRKPRVQIEYDVEIGGALRKTELPWVTGVMADLSGSNSGNLKDLENRSFAEVDADNFDSYLKSQTPGLDYVVPNVLSGEGSIGVNVTLEKLGDFTPDEMARKIGADIEEIKLVKVKEGSHEYYQITQDGPMSRQLGETCDSLNKLASTDYIAMKLGDKAAALEVALIDDLKDPNKSILRITRKGPLAKLLDTRDQLKELLTKAGSKSGARKILDEITADPELMRQIVQDNDN